MGRREVVLIGLLLATSVAACDSERRGASTTLTTVPAESLDTVDSQPSPGSIDGLTTLRLDSPDWRLVEEGRQEPIGAQGADGGLIGGHYSVYDAPDGQTQIHLVVWPVDESRSLASLLRFWSGRAQIVDVGGTSIGYSPAGAGMPATAWWLDGRGYLVMSSVTAPSDVTSMRRILDEGPTEPMTTAPASSVVTSTSTGNALPETQAIGMEHGMLGYVVPADAVTDPTSQGTLPSFVIGYARWRTDCCLLRLAVENIDPPMPDEEATATFTANGLEWTVYDSGPRDGTQMIAKATNALGTVLISAQVGPSQQKTDPGVAQRLVEQVAKTAILVPAK